MLLSWHAWLARDPGMLPSTRGRWGTVANERWKLLWSC